MCFPRMGTERSSQKMYRTIVKATEKRGGIVVIKDDKTNEEIGGDVQKVITDLGRASKPFSVVIDLSSLDEVLSPQSLGVMWMLSMSLNKTDCAWLAIAGLQSKFGENYAKRSGTFRGTLQSEEIFASVDDASGFLKELMEADRSGTSFESATQLEPALI